MTDIKANAPITSQQIIQAEIDNCGKFSAYDSQLSIPEITGTRVVKCLYQTNKKTGKKAGENSYTRVKTDSISEEEIRSRISELAPFVLGFLRSKEDEIVKELHKGGADKVYSTSLGMNAVLARLESDGISARLSKEDIAAWFSDRLEGELSVAFADKMGISDTPTEAELERLGMVVAAYKEKFTCLAAPSPKLSQADCAAMSKVISTCGDAASSIIGERFKVRLDSLAAKDDMLLMAL